MDFKGEYQRVHSWFNQIGNVVLRLLWHFLHILVSLWCLGVGIAHLLESHVISSGLLKRYNSLNISKLWYLAIVMESKDAYQIPKVIQLLQWLAAIGVKHVCLYDAEGYDTGLKRNLRVLKKSKAAILEELKNVTVFEKTDEKDLLLDQKRMTLEFASISDGKEAVAKAANLHFAKCLKFAGHGVEQEEQIFTEAHLFEALRALGFRGPDPDLLLVYGPARCHLGFPAWRIRYTEIVHMGPLHSMRYGSLIKAIYKFTTIRQNYGK